MVDSQGMDITTVFILLRQKNKLNKTQLIGLISVFGIINSMQKMNLSL